MIILDTNIISEMMKTVPDQHVKTWLQEQVSTQLFVTTISIAEINYGIQALCRGKRQKQLWAQFERVMSQAFRHRILNFTKKDAAIYGAMMAQRKKIGKPLAIADGQIASIAHNHQFSLASRNIKDFAHCDIELINPFTD